MTNAQQTHILAGVGMASEIERWEHMITRKLHALIVALGLCLTGASYAAGAAIYQREATDGAVELSNLGGDDDGAQLSVAADAAATQGVQFGSQATAPLAATAAPGADAAANSVGSLNVEAPETLESRLAQYRDKMVNPTLAPNGMPANPAVQRRYLMVKKSDYVPGN